MLPVLIFGRIDYRRSLHGIGPKNHVLSSIVSERDFRTTDETKAYLIQGRQLLVRRAVMHFSINVDWDPSIASFQFNGDMKRVWNVFHQKWVPKGVG